MGGGALRTENVRAAWEMEWFVWLLRRAGESAMRVVAARAKAIV